MARDPEEASMERGSELTCVCEIVTEIVTKALPRLAVRVSLGCVGPSVGPGRAVLVIGGEADAA